MIFPARAAGVSAQSVAVADAATGELLFSKDASRPMAPASTTKLLTAYVACSLCPMNRTIRIERRHLLTEGSMMYLKEGETVALETLLYGLLLASGNDAALAVAELVCGSQEEFVRQMNIFAASLGMSSSHFKNPSGLPQEGHVSTAEDMAKLMIAFSKQPELMKISGTREYACAGRTIINHNRLLWQCGYIDGGKTGYTKAAGRCLVTTAEKNGRRLVAVTLNDPDDWNDHKKLYEEYFSMYTEYALPLPDLRMNVVGGARESLSLCEAGRVSLWLTEEERGRLKTELYLPRFAYAPVRKGAEVGSVRFTLDGTELARIPLHAAEGVPLRQNGKRI